MLMDCPPVQNQSFDCTTRVADTHEGAVPHQDRPARIPWSVGEHKGVCIMLVCVGGGRVLTCGYGHGRTATSPHALRPGHSALRHRCFRDHLPDLPRALARHLRRRISSHLRFTPPVDVEEVECGAAGVGPSAIRDRA